MLRWPRSFVFTPAGRLICWLLCVCPSVIPLGAAPPTLEAELLQQPLTDVVRRARVLGDPRRGAVLFYRQSLNCTQCHVADEGVNPLGPDLAELGERATYEHVIQSILHPTEVVREGFRSEKLLLADGRLIIGMLRQQTASEVELVVPGQSELLRIPLEDIEDRSPASSIMPTGLINQLDGAGEFYDLVSYVVEAGRRGPAGAASLKPDPAALQLPALPEYELNLDHAGLIGAWNTKSYKNGEALYLSLCINCHGNRDEPGSLPNALRFAEGQFQAGADPYSMYKTLTHGFRMMLPQRQLVPQQKYDVIHYIREAYLKPHNPTQYVAVDATYLASLPKGQMRGPAATRQEPWREMDYGSFLINTYEITGRDTLPRQGITEEEKQRAAREGRPAGETWPENTNFAYKGIAIRLDQGGGGVADGSHWLAFDHDTLRVAGAWSGSGFIDWEGILFNGRHAVTPRTVGDLHFGNLPGPGWANPQSGTFEDPRLRGKDGRAYGPLPHSWGRYRGLYKTGDRVVVAYSIGEASILESHAVQQHQGGAIWRRTLNVGPASHPLAMRVAPAEAVDVRLTPDSAASLAREQGYWVVRIAPRQSSANFAVDIASRQSLPSGLPQADTTVEDLQALTRGGPPQWPEAVTTMPERGEDTGAFVVDVLTRPTRNPWRSRLRLSGLDFLPGGQQMVACCWDGDVWLISGIDDLSGELQWRRIASGLFQPLGIKFIDGKIYVTCRDQIVILNDVNGDGETDFYECFNNDHQVTDHFHEFAMGLQVDAAGNLYYAKSARHARDSLVPQHGTLLQVSPDGEQTTIVANGFRAANGVCLNPDGSFFVTDQEGHWNPMNRINRVTRGGFYGNMYSYGAPADSSDAAMLPPLCWPNKEFDRSPAELVWVDSKTWGNFNGALLNLSYGYGKIYVVPQQRVDDVWQGGVCPLPLPRLPTGIMRARFHPGNGQMYACGLFAWGSDQSESPGGLYRIRYTGRPAMMPIGLAAHSQGLTLTLSDAVDPQSASDPENYLVDTWALKRSANYGSQRYDEKSLRITAAHVSEDGRSITLTIPEIQPTWCMQVSYKLRSESGEVFTATLQNTVHRLAAAADAQ